MTFRDPGCTKSTKRGTAPTGVGTEYDLTTVFEGSEDTMVYTVRKWEPPSSGANPAVVQLFGKGSKATGLDTISFAKGPSGSSGAETTTFTYTADIQLRRFLWLFTPLVRSSIEQLGVDAIDGLKKHYGMSE